MEHSTEINHLAEALAKAQGEMGHAEKDRQNPHFRSDYATLASILDAVRPVLSKHGLSFTQPATNDENGNVVVETLLMHSSGQWMRSRIGCKPQKQDAQGVGSVITYLRRYALSSIVGLTQADDDAEGEQDRRVPSKGADVPMQAPKQQKPPAKPQGIPLITSAGTTTHESGGLWLEAFQQEIEAAGKAGMATKCWEFNKATFERVAEKAPAALAGPVETLRQRVDELLDDERGMFADDQKAA